MISARSSRFSGFSTKNTFCSIFSTGLADGVIEMRTGFFSRLFASDAISFGMVAENSRVWRFAGRYLMMRLTSGKKPMSSMRSASSSTKHSTLFSLTMFCPIRSHRRPGVAIRISAPRWIALDLRHLGYAAENHRRGERCIARVLADIFVDLQCKLTRRRQDQRADNAGLAFFLAQVLDDRHGKRAGLARAGLRAAEQVPPRQYRRDRLLLDGGRLLIARFAQSAQDILLYLQFIKFHGGHSFPFPKLAHFGKSRLP